MYVERLKDVKKALSSNDIQGIRKQLYISIFNSSFVHRKTNLNSNSGFLCLYNSDPDSAIKNEDTKSFSQLRYWDDVIEFCLNTDACDRLHMSLKDFMYLDVWSYEYLRSKIRNTPRKESAALDEILKKTSNRG